MPATREHRYAVRYDQVREGQGAALRALLAAHELTAGQAAAIMGISRTALVARMQGHTDISLAEAEALTTALRVSIKALTGAR